MPVSDARQLETIMDYRPLKYDHIANDSIRDIFRRCDWFLADVHSMIAALPIKPDGPAGDWSIALVLLCVIDGVAKYVYPIEPRPSVRRRFEKFVADKILRDDSKQGLRDAHQLHEEFRGLLVHELGVDKREYIRDNTMAEPAVSKCDQFPSDEWDVQLLEDRVYSEYVFPVFTLHPHEGKQREVLCTAVLYGALKRALVELSMDQLLIEAAAAAYPSLVVKPDEER